MPDGQVGSDPDQDRLRLVLDISNAIGSILDLRELFPVISRLLRPIFHHDGGGLGVYYPEREEIRGFALDTPPGFVMDPEGTPWPLEGTPAGEAIHSRSPVIVSEPDRERYHSAVVRRNFDQGVKSGCAVPLLRGPNVIGALVLVSKRPGNFSREQLPLLTDISRPIAVALENALNFENAKKARYQLAQERDRSTLLLEINNAIVLHLDLKNVIKSLSASLIRIVPHDGAFLTLLSDPASKKMQVQALDLHMENPNAFAEGVVIDCQDTPEGRAMETRRPVLVSTRDLRSTYTSPWVKEALARGIRSGCAVPMIAHGRVLGALSVVSTKEDAFTGEDAELFELCSRQIAIAVQNALAFREIESLKNKLATEKLYLEDEIRSEHNFNELIGSSSSFEHVLKQVKTVAPTDSCVLIRGETGTGKELIARAIHALSNRKDRALVKLNCSAIPTGLLESELFGHEKGAFTGAIMQRIGRFELAHRGTLFLDEVGDIPPELQPKLLRVLQEQEFERLGSAKTQKVDVRLIAATNCDLEQMVAEKKYRKDLYYRIGGFPITIPPLRERKEDIPELVRFFTQKYARRIKKEIEVVPDDAMDLICGYHWPGNIRELEHYIERAVIFTQGSALEITPAELKPESSAAVDSAGPTTLEESERRHILAALEATNWVIGGPNGTAAQLGLKRTTLISRMQKLGISRR